MAPIQRYTWLGISSIFIWASLVAIIKLVSEQLSPIQSIAMIYSFSTITIVIMLGLPRLKRMPKTYLYGCGALFVAYEVLFLSAVAFSDNREQVLIIAMINYLWPPLMIVFAILFKQLSYRPLAIAGFILAVMGLMMVVNPQITEPFKMLAVLQQNPMAYAFAFAGAIIWPCYSLLTKRYAQGHNAVAFFFLISASVLWLLHFGLKETFVMPSLTWWGVVAVAGALIGMAYSNWNQSMQFGNAQLLILATYFMPVFSSLMSMFILGVQPQWSFWFGASLVTMGAMICWKNTANK
jgi:drug/metabolite transporter (DMT)-like permease